MYLESIPNFHLRKVTYEFDETLVAIGTDIEHGVNDLSEGSAQGQNLLLYAFPWHVAKVKNLRWSLRVPKL